MTFLPRRSFLSGFTLVALMLHGTQLMGEDGVTPITSLPFEIKTPGRYALVGDLSFSAATGAAVNVAADDVSLDLGGHTLLGIAGSEST